MFISQSSQPRNILTCSHTDDKGVLRSLKELAGQDAAAHQHLTLTHGELVDWQLQQLALWCGVTRHRGSRRAVSAQVDNQKTSCHGVARKAGTLRSGGLRLMGRGLWANEEGYSQ